MIQAPAQVDRLLPAAAAVPVARHRKRSGICFGVVEVGALQAAGEGVVLLKRAFQQRHFVAEIDLLFRRGNVGAGRQTVAAVVDPRFFPGPFQARTDVCGIADAGFNGVFGAG